MRLRNATTSHRSPPSRWLAPSISSRVAPGTVLNVDASLGLVESSLNSLSQRQVVLPLERTQPPRPAFDNLKILLKQTVDLAGFDGLAGIYLHDLQTNQEVHLEYRQGEELPVQPDVAYTASSIIKVPIMVSVYRRLGENPDAETMRLMGEMITKSGNETADWLMDRVIDGNRAPLTVTEDMQAAGLQNTFLGGYFTFGSPLLAQIEIPLTSARTSTLTPTFIARPPPPISVCSSRISTSAPRPAAGL